MRKFFRFTGQELVKTHGRPRDLGTGRNRINVIVRFRCNMEDTRPRQTGIGRRGKNEDAGMRSSQLCIPFGSGVAHRNHSRSVTNGRYPWNRATRSGIMSQLRSATWEERSTGTWHSSLLIASGRFLAD